MNIKAIIVLFASFFAISARADEAHNSDVSLKISSENLESLEKASQIIAKYFAENGEQDYQIQFNQDGETKFKVTTTRVSQIDNLINKLNFQFGDSISIERVDVWKLRNGTQDEWMGH